MSRVGRLAKVRGWITQQAAGRLDYQSAGMALALFVLALALYVRTMAPGLLDGDEGEFQTNVYKLGVSHTGYPFFFLFGKLFTVLVPVGTIATRVNLFSAFWGALAIAAVFLLVRFLTRNIWAAAFSALLLLASRVEWSQAIIPRPYTLNSLFVIVVTYLLFLWRVGKVDLSVPVFAFGLSLTNHRTFMWFAPAAIIFVLWSDYNAAIGNARPTRNWITRLREWIKRSSLFKPHRLISLVAAFLLPLLLYGYIWWRGESDVGVEFHWKDFGDEIMGGNVRLWWRFGPVDWLVSRITELYLPMLIEQFTVFGFIAGLIGIAALALDKPPRGWDSKLPARAVLVFIVLANLANTAFCVIFWVIDIDKFFLPSFITFLFLTGVGIATLWDWVSSRRGRWIGVAQAAMAIVFIGATGFLVSRNFALNDWSTRSDAVRIWDENLAQPIEPYAVIAGPWESLTPLEYAMYVDGRRRDLERWKLLVKQYQMGLVPYGSRQDEIEKAVREGWPVYLTVHPSETETLGGLLNEFRLTRVGELWRVLDAPPEDSAVLTQLRDQGPLQVFADREGRTVELVGYAVRPSTALDAGDFALATMYWRVPQSFPEHLSVSLRLVDSQNRLIAQRDGEPGSGLRPVNGWAPNEIVQDDAGFLIPPDSPPGVYHLAIVVYSSETGESLTASGGPLFSLTDLVVARNPNPPAADVLSIPHPVDIPIPPLRLRGYAWGKDTPKAGETLDLSLWWQLDQPTAHGEQVVLSLRNSNNLETELYAGPPIPEFPASDWGRSSMLRGRYSITTPIEISGSVKLVVKSEGKAFELPIYLRPSGRTFAIPRIAHTQTAQIGDSIKLLGFDVDKTTVRRGDPVRLTLYWQALKKPPDSFTVFTHVLDSSGELRGQKDSVPRAGELPTDEWLPNEVITDAYDIAIPSDAPAGGYQLEVGMYVASTGERVPLYAASGAREPGDRLILAPGLVVQ